MQIEAKDRLARLNDSSDEAAGVRLRAAIAAAGLTPTAFANRIGQNPNAIFNVMRGQAFPNRMIMYSLYREYRIDPAFVMFGDYGKLPIDVQNRIFDALVAASNEPDQSGG